MHFFHDRTYGESPYHVGEMGLKLARGLQAHNVIACAKHFALNSIENSRFYVDVRCDERTLREVYLPHFKKIVLGDGRAPAGEEPGAASVMSAYNKFRGEHCGHSGHLLTRVLRDEWGWTGFVTSDWVHGVRDGAKGLAAGLDVEMPATHRYGAPLRAALDRPGSGVTWADADAAVRRVVRTKLRFALRPDPPGEAGYPPAALACAAHAALAREAAEQCAVLVKNARGCLPFDPVALGRVAVVGRLADRENTGDMGSSNVAARAVVTPLAGLRAWAAARAGNGRAAPAVEYADGKDVGAAAALAGRAARGGGACVVVVGFTARDEGEYIVYDIDQRGEAQKTWDPVQGYLGGGDRKDIALRAHDVALIKACGAANPSRTVVVYVGGSAPAVAGWRDAVPAILFSWYCGQEGGHALARLLFGEANPSGKLPFTIPLRQGDLPPFDPWAETAEYGYYHGMSLFDKKRLPVAYPFGHGLSYTRFAYSDLRVHTPRLELVVNASARDASDATLPRALRASVTVRNTGDRAGAEVAQLYVAFPQAGEPGGAVVDRPVKLLRGFEKVRLAPGQAVEVSFAVPASELAYFEEEAGGSGGGRWRVAAARYAVLCGGSSAPAEGGLLRAPFEVVAASRSRL